VLCDADLAVLAGDPARYAAYADAVREEYAHVPDDAFRAGRAAVLSGLLAQQPLFRTPSGQASWEAAARVNVAAELAALQAGSQ
jgi:predicted metal-dependent HD superfamily phosphohydrolase